MSRINALTAIKPFLAKHQSEILMGVGIAGMIFSTVWGIKATTKAVEKIDIKKEELNKDKLTFGETVKEVWPLYTPVILSMAASIPCIIYSNKVVARKNAALMAALSVSESSFHEYKEKAKEILDEKDIEKVEHGIAKDRVVKTEPGNVILTGAGDSLFLEPLSGRYFRSSWLKISGAANRLYAGAIGDVQGEITLTDWYDAIGLEPTAGSENMGWSLADGVSGLIDISITSALTEDNEPCGSIYYRTQPKSLL